MAWNSKSARVGQRVRVKCPHLGLDIDTLGYIIDITASSDGGWSDILVIFENGICEGFVYEEYSKLLQRSNSIDEVYAEYEFSNLENVRRDFERGYWKFSYKILNPRQAFSPENYYQIMDTGDSSRRRYYVIPTPKGDK